MTAPRPLDEWQIFVPCELKNYANHGGHWTGKAGYQKRLRELVWLYARQEAGSLDANQPKFVMLRAYVWNYFDTHDGLRNACKPLVDGLVQAKVIHSDAHDCGHQFLYTQVINRQARGVKITVQPR